MNYKYLAIGAAAMLLIYLTGAFVAADLNIANWNGFGRYMSGLLGGAIGIIAIINSVRSEAQP